MNSKLIEFRDHYTQLQDSAVQQSAFKEGFNMALELNLTTKFIEWMSSEEAENYIKKSFPNFIADTDKEAAEFLKKLYNYWINNIFIPIYK